MGHVSAAPLLVVTGMAFEARLAAAAGVEVCYGQHAGKLATRLAERLMAPCGGVLSFGVAGGLDPSLAPGDIVVAECIVAEGVILEVDPAWCTALRAALPRAKRGALVGSAVAVSRVADKQMLFQRSGALAVDMESHLAARAAFAAGVPFAACRVVLDPAARAVPPAALAGLDEAGRTDLPVLLRALLAEPGQVVDLLRLARDAAIARRTLTTARHALGERFSLPVDRALLAEV